MRHVFRPNLQSTRGIQNLAIAVAATFAGLTEGAQTFTVRLSSLANCYVTIGQKWSSSVASASQTVASPGVFTTATQAFTAGTAVVISPGAAGAVPGGFTAGTIYYVVAGGLTTTACELSATPGGTAIAVTTSAACVLNVVAPATATSGMLIKASDPPIDIGCIPGDVISVIEQTTVSGGPTLNVVELT